MRIFVLPTFPTTALPVYIFDPVGTNTGLIDGSEDRVAHTPEDLASQVFKLLVRLDSMARRKILPGLFNGPAADVMTICFEGGIRIVYAPQKLTEEQLGQFTRQLDKLYQAYLQQN
jgi:hypothetical protein